MDSQPQVSKLDIERDVEELLGCRPEEFLPKKGTKLFVETTAMLCR
jgi:hypothetical protein